MPALHLVQHRIDLLLLAVNDQVQLLQQVVAVAGLDFQLGQALVGIVRWVHGGIGQDFYVRPGLRSQIDVKKSCKRLRCKRWKLSKQ